MNYRHFNTGLLVALLALGPGLLLVPWLRQHAGMLYPGCMLEQLTGHSCPMCGLTTSLRNLIAGRSHTAVQNPLTIPMATVILIEIIARGVLSLCRLSPSAIQRVQRYDRQVHLTLALAYLIYCAAFFLTRI